MAKMNLADLRKLREEKRLHMDMRDADNKTIQVIIGMGTSGIAAGAKETLAAFIHALETKGITNVAVRQTGSLGLDHAEPTVEVIMPDMPRTIYGKVDAKVAAQIVEQHIEDKRLIDEHVYDRPAADIVEGEA